MIQTAEGALNGTHSILRRMRELAVQASNDTNTVVDRKEIQKEINELLDEIDRISNTTQFNTQNLLGGSYTGEFHIGANEGQNIELTVSDMRKANLGQGTGTVTTYEADSRLTYSTVDYSDPNSKTFTVDVGGTELTEKLESNLLQTTYRD